MNSSTIKSALVGATALSMMMASAAVAQPGPGYGWRMGPGMGYGQQGQGWGRMGIIDLNDDGRISDAEAATAADEVFTAMEADDDGQVTKEEYMAVRMGPGTGWNAERQAAMQAQKEARYSGMDGDGDGVVSKGEFLDAAQKHHKAADTDGDGGVSPWEHRRQGWF